MRKTAWWGLAFVAAVAAGWPGQSSAAGTSMVTGGRTTQPVGHYEFCRRAPKECNQTTRSVAPARLTKNLQRRLTSVNNGVNARITPKTDMEIWGQEEVWSFPNSVGDCEDYVLEKRRLLIQQGLSPANALITVVRQPNGEGHAVLTVRTTRGDFILDNLESKILPWEQTVYTYLKRQSEANSGAWLSITDGRADAVASVR